MAGSCWVGGGFWLGWWQDLAGLVAESCWVGGGFWLGWWRDLAGLVAGSWWDPDKIVVIGRTEMVLLLLLLLLLLLFRESMLDILFIYSKEKPDLAYRQGMHEILAPIMFVLHAEERDPDDSSLA